MKKTLLIFDGNICLRELSKQCRQDESICIELFPLTDNWGVIKEVESFCQKKGKVVLIQTAGLVNREVEEIRGKIALWSAKLGDHKIDGISIKEHLLSPQKEASFWWFSFFSDKDNLSTNMFLHIAQLQAVDTYLSGNECQTVFISIFDKNLLCSMKRIGEKRGLSITPLKSFDNYPAGLRNSFLARLNNWGKVGKVVRAFIWFLTTTYKFYGAKQLLGKYKREECDNSMLFVSYFPLIDIEASKQGVFKNKYAPYLQEKLEQMGKQVTWLLFFVDINGVSFSDAAKLAKKFAEKGERVFFLPEFITLSGIANALKSWITLMFKANRLLKSDKTFLFSDFTIPEALPILENVWHESFIGLTGLTRIVYFELFKEFFKKNENYSECLYYMEMKGWEKSMLSAIRLKKQGLKTIGFQHAYISENFFFYFPHKSELKNQQDVMSFPFPSVVACNGEAARRMFIKNGVENVEVVEAVRHLYLNKYFNNGVGSEQKENILLVVCPGINDETEALLSFLHVAFPHKGDTRIWIKGHPVVPLQEKLTKLGIELEECGYEIKDEPIENLLAKVNMVFVGTSSVSVEALAFGCIVLTPFSSNSLFTSPLSSYENYYLKALDPEILRDLVGRIANKQLEVNKTGFHSFPSKYWCLDTSLQRWEKLLAKKN